MCNDDDAVVDSLIDNLAFYQVIENKLKKQCSFQGPTPSSKQRLVDNNKSNIGENTEAAAVPQLISTMEVVPDSKQTSRESNTASSNLHPPNAARNTITNKITATTGTDSRKTETPKLDDSILYLNRYCAKLPSDTL